MSAPISIDAVLGVRDQTSFVRLLRDHLNWPIQGEPAFEDLTFDWFPKDFGLREDELRDSRLYQLRPFVDDQPWGIFFLHLQSQRLYLTELRRIVRALVPKKRKLQDYPTWNPPHLLFICTCDWKDYTFAHFEGQDPAKAKLSTFGWEYQSPFVRTLCEFNIPQLRYPEDRDMFGLDHEAWTKQWSAAFDVKKVTDKFYEEYDKVFREMKKVLALKFKVSPRLYDKKYEDWTQKERQLEEPLHLFVQNLVNRLMFLKFLEKRRWLDFNPNYLRDLYNRALSEKKNFYKEYLFYVFFAGLNRQVTHLVFEKDWAGFVGETDFRDRIGVLPFLNGGLFEKEPIDEEIEIPNEAFTGLFDLLGRYNFTINEDTPLNVEVAVNPEMLGKVFEESVIARKEKGAYYTPRNIVSFMSREALKNHLSHCNIENAQAKIEKLVDEHSANRLQAADAIEIYKSLHNIKVLDPAVGSGAFPVNMMLELIQIYKTIGEKLEHDHPYLIQNKLANPKDVYNLKKQIIQNSLYGVDIEEFAINIARLRFWLSLAVDFPIDFSTREEFIQRVHEIEPLPNLLYKLRCGDSLLAHYQGVSLEPHGRLASGEYGRGRRNRIKDAIGDVAQMKQEFYGQGDSLKKQEKQRQIESSLRGLVVREIDLEIAAMERELGQEVLFELTKVQRLERTQIEKEIQRLRSVRVELSTMNGLPSDFPVIWDVEFGEVMTEGGFDVVIANPPYVRQEEIKHLKEDLKLHYECYTGTSDLYVYFYERSVQLLKTGGTIAFISSNKFFRAGYGEKLRRYLNRETALKTLIDFGELPVFLAGIDTAIVMAQKGVAKDLVGVASFKDQHEIEQVATAYTNHRFRIRQDNLSDKGWSFWKKHSGPIMKRLEAAEVRLGDFVGGTIYYGIKTGFNDAFVIDESTKETLISEHKDCHKLLRRWLDGNEILRWRPNYQGQYLIAIASSSNQKWPWSETRTIAQAERTFSKTYPSVYEHLVHYSTKLKRRQDQGEYWWELRSCTYWAEFDRPKIVFNETSKELHAFIDDSGIVVNKTGFIIVSKQNEYVLGVLNSKLMDFFFRSNFPTWGDPWKGGRIQFRKDRMVNLPIAKPTAGQRRAIEERVEKILVAKKNDGKADTSALEKEIDHIVSEIYQLTGEEIEIIEGHKP